MMKIVKFALVVITLGLLRVSTCAAGIFISTNGFAYFSPTVQSELQLTNVVAADGGSGFILALEPNGQVTNFYGTPSPVNPPAGLSNVTAISINGYGAVLALTGEGTVVGWGLDYGSPTPPLPAAAQVPIGLSNVVAISAGVDTGLGLLGDGTVTSWPGNTSLPGGLTNVVAIDAGEGNLALTADGTVVSWGFPSLLSPPALSNVIAISTLGEGILALLANGTVIGWDTAGVHTNLLAPEVTNTVAISGAPDHFLALQADGSVVIGGTPPLVSFAEPLANVFYLGRMMTLGTAIVVEGDGQAVFTVQPGSQTVGWRGTIYLHARAVGQPPLQYQWQFNGTNLPGATNADLIITNATAGDAGNYQAIVSFRFDLGPYWAGSAVAAVTVLPPPAQIPALLSPPVPQSNGGFMIKVNATSGEPFSPTNAPGFTLQASSDLLNWTPLTNALTFSYGLINFTDPEATSTPARFYRLLGQ